MKDIKVIFRGQKSPSGMRTNIEYLVGEPRLDLWKKDGRFDMEIEMPRKETPKKKAPKKDKGEK